MMYVCMCVYEPCIMVQQLRCRPSLCVSMHGYVYVCVHVCLYQYASALCVCVHVCVCVCMFMRTCMYLTDLCSSPSTLHATATLQSSLLPRKESIRTATSACPNICIAKLIFRWSVHVGNLSLFFSIFWETGKVSGESCWAAWPAASSSKPSS